jgi:penicillin amidase
MPEDERIIFERYAAGVNAALRERPSQIHALLKLDHEPWTEIDSLGIIDLFNWQIAENFGTELMLAKIYNTFGEEKATSLAPVYPAEGPFMIRSGELPTHLRIMKAANSQRNQLIDGRVSDRVSALQGGTPRGDLNRLLAVLHECRRVPIGAGSNAWAISPSRSATGKTLLAYDPHLAISAPSPWYHAHIQTKKGEAAGFTIPGLPLIVAGQNKFCAFGFTVNNTDTQDVYVERVQPGNSNVYEFCGKWETMKTEEEIIRVRGREAIDFTTRWTRHGPIISDLTPGDGPVMALRWTVLDSNPVETIGGFRRMMQATSWDQWRKAAMKLEGSPKNFIYADRDGNIGAMTTGRLPLRKPGAGNLPVPGWDGKNEWTGFVPPHELPFSHNPAKGYVASANEKPWTRAYKHDKYLNGRWAHPYRHQRIEELMRGNQSVTVDDMKAMQLDDKSTLAPVIVQMALPALKASGDPELVWAARELDKWDYHMKKDRLAPLLYHAMYTKVARNVFVEELGDELAKEYLKDQYLFQERLRIILQDSDKTPDIFKRSMKDALGMLKDQLGANRQKWTWGQLHNLRWEALPAMLNPKLAQKFTFPAEPIGVNGGPDTLSSARYEMARPFRVSTFYTSSRLIVDWSHPESAWAVNATGQSEHADSQHQFDLSKFWLRGEYYPLVCDMAALNTKQTSAFVLTPSVSE